MSCDLDLRPSDSQSLSFCVRAAWTTCANLYQNLFIRFQNIILISMVADEDIVLPASLAR